jgi:hypothetical protein
LIAADRDRVAAVIVGAIDQDTANAGFAHLAECDLLRASRAPKNGWVLVVGAKSRIAITRPCIGVPRVLKRRHNLMKKLRQASLTPTHFFVPAG